LRPGQPRLGPACYPPSDVDEQTIPSVRPHVKRRLTSSPLLSLLALPIWVTTVPLAFFYASAALFLVVATLFAGLQSTGTLAAFAVAFALIMGAPAYVSVVVYIRAAERLAPVEVVTRTRAYHLVVPVLTVAWAVYMAVYLSKGGPHIAIIAAILAVRRL